MADHSISGDSDHMVLWGQSAGGNAANSYGYANPEDPIVAGIVAQSGTTSQINSANTTAFTILAKQFGCDGLDAEEELTCMQGVDNDSLHHVIRNGTNVPSFSPVADGVTLFANNTARLEDGQVAKVVSPVGSKVFPCRRKNIADDLLASDSRQHR
jgi:carboxylesterase type B